MGPEHRCRWLPRGGPAARACGEACVPRRAPGCVVASRGRHNSRPHTLWLQTIQTDSRSGSPKQDPWAPVQALAGLCSPWRPRARMRVLASSGCQRRPAFLGPWPLPASRSQRCGTCQSRSDSPDSASVITSPPLSLALSLPSHENPCGKTGLYPRKSRRISHLKILN